MSDERFTIRDFLKTADTFAAAAAAGPCPRHSPGVWITRMGRSRSSLAGKPLSRVSGNRPRATVECYRNTDKGKHRNQNNS